MRAELLNNVLPERVQTTSMQKGATTVLDLLFITFQTYLPSEPSARVEGLTTVEAPLRAAKKFSGGIDDIEILEAAGHNSRQRLRGKPRAVETPFFTEDSDIFAGQLR